MNNPDKIVRKQMCLLIAAHNEEVVIGSTLKSAINAGMKPDYIYVVDDNSSDSTSKIAKSILPRKNVLRVRRSGKGLALTKASKKFELSKKYRWIHIADADGTFASNYFNVFRREIRVENAAATGYIKSLPGKRVSEYRAYEYTVGMELHRRVQSLLGVISIIPGPTSCFRWDVFSELDFDTKALTEDFDVTLQIHRNNMGRIQYIPGAVAYTQDPLTLKAYINQITRWNRGVLQGMIRHKIGTRPKAIDAYLQYQILQSLFLALNILIWVPYMTAGKGGASFLAMTFIMDVALTFVIALLTAIRSRRSDILAAFPIIYGFKWISLAVFLKSFIEVIVLRRYRVSSGTWSNGSSRRYKIPVTSN